MNKKTLGAVIKEGRDALRLTQRGLAELVGVKASHIAYIENGHRNPSLALLRRLADALGLNRKELLFLSHPDAKYLMDEDSGSARKREDAWQQFSSNRAALRRHNVTRAELKVLKQVALLEHVAHPRHFLFILNSIRQAGDREA
ncbi:MAG TPA: helix-turn-helix transcriptional regulator [Candidatus Binataceae bacterium]|nr:helix-turn-helix transcriptional regulator [Candidatus Binataceae bacterium]